MKISSLYPTEALSSVKASHKYALIGGPFGSKLGRRDYVNNGVPVIRGANLPNEAQFSFDDFVFVTEVKARELASNLAFPGDIVVTQRGTLGQVGLIPDASPYDKFVISQSQMKLTVDRRRADPLFIYYALRSPIGQHQIQSRAITAGVPHINLSLFQQLQIPVPAIETQHKIAAILSAYDDLIENNTRRIQILEEMAQAIYREWFVELRFPGHEGVRMVDSELGPIPDGWQVRKLSTIAKVVMGQSPPSRFYNETGEGLPFHQGVTNFSRHFPTHKTFATSGDRRAEVGDILFSVRAPVGRINVADRGLILGRGLCAIRPSPLTGTFVLFQLKHVFQTEDIIGSGSIFNAVKRSDMENRALLWPPEEPVQDFAELATPKFDLIKNLTLANTNLRQTRDLLLPRLISGEIDVSDLDIGNAEPAA